MTIIYCGLFKRLSRIQYYHALKLWKAIHLSGLSDALWADTWVQFKRIKTGYSLLLCFFLCFSYILKSFKVILQNFGIFSIVTSNAEICTSWTHPRYFTLIINFKFLNFFLCLVSILKTAAALFSNPYKNETLSKETGGELILFLQNLYEIASGLDVKDYKIFLILGDLSFGTEQYKHCFRYFFNKTKQMFHVISNMLGVETIWMLSLFYQIILPI